MTAWFESIGDPVPIDPVTLRIDETYSVNGLAWRIGERDHWICGICELTLDPEHWQSRLGPHWDSLRGKLKPEVDHVIPQSWGGLNDDDNLQITHASCNRNKSNYGQRSTDQAQQHLAYELGLATTRPLEKIGRPPKGSMRTALEAALELDTLSPKALSNFAASLMREDSERAEGLYRRAAERGDAKAVLHVGRALELNGALHEARQLYLRTAERGDFQPVLYFARRLERNGALDQARELYIRAIDLGDNDQGSA